MAESFSSSEIQSVQTIHQYLTQGQTRLGITHLEALTDETYAGIPEKKRQSRGITWVVQRIGRLLVQACEDTSQVRDIARSLYASIPEHDRLSGVPIFMMAAYGKSNLVEALEFFTKAGASSDWVVREFAAAGLHKVIPFHRERIHPWLAETAQNQDPNLRRMVSEALRPVTENRWLQQQPDYSLSVLCLMFQESHPYPRTSVGNNLSDLSRHNPELIFTAVAELMQIDDPNSSWIAHRACRNLVKADPTRVMDLLGVDEYHYKDRHFHR